MNKIEDERQKAITQINIVLDQLELLESIRFVNKQPTKLINEALVRGCELASIINATRYFGSGENLAVHMFMLEIITLLK